MQKTFWGYVRTDLEDTLRENTKQYNSKNIERNIYSKTIDDGVEAGIRNEGMLVGSPKINYAVFLNGGTKDHDIAPKDKKALRWVGAGGRFFFSKGHRVKGIKGSHFIENSAKETFSRLDKLFTQSLRKENVI